MDFIIILRQRGLRNIRIYVFVLDRLMQVIDCCCGDGRTFDSFVVEIAHLNERKSIWDRDSQLFVNDLFLNFFFGFPRILTL